MSNSKSQSMTFLWRILEGCAAMFIGHVEHHLNSTVVSSQETLFSMQWLACSPHIWCSLVLPFRFRDLLLPGIYIRQWIREYIESEIKKEREEDKESQLAGWIAVLFKSLKEVRKNITFVISWVIWLMVVFVLLMRNPLFTYLSRGWFNLYNSKESTFVLILSWGKLEKYYT